MAVSFTFEGLQEVERAMNKYHLALGKFVSMFSHLERAVQFALWESSGMKGPVARALLSGQRMDAALSLLSRSAEAEGWSKERSNKLAALSEKLRELNKLRNDILHLGAELTGGDEWLVSNKPIAHIESRVRAIVISPEAIDAASDDLQTSLAHIMMLFWSEVAPDEAVEFYSRQMQRPWRYKPQLLSPQRKRSPPNPPKQRRPPESSPAK